MPQQNLVDTFRGRNSKVDGRISASVVELHDSKNKDAPKYKTYKGNASGSDKSSSSINYKTDHYGDPIEQTTPQLDEMRKMIENMTQVHKSQRDEIMKRVMDIERRQ